MMTPEQSAHELLQARLREIMQAQPWWQRWSNTLTMTVSGLATFAWWLTSTGTELSPEITYTVGAILFLAGVLGIKQTPNGVTPRLIEQMTTQLGGTVAAYGRHAWPDTEE